MVESECKKCHKPLANGDKCEACKQKTIDNMKSIGTAVVAGIAVIVTTAIAAIADKKKK